MGHKTRTGWVAAACALIIGLAGSCGERDDNPLPPDAGSSRETVTTTMTTGTVDVHRQGSDIATNATGSDGSTILGGDRDGQLAAVTEQRWEVIREWLAGYCRQKAGRWEPFIEANQIEAIRTNGESGLTVEQSVVQYQAMIDLLKADFDHFDPPPEAEWMIVKFKDWTDAQIGLLQALQQTALTFGVASSQETQAQRKDRVAAASSAMQPVVERAMDVPMGEPVALGFQIVGNDETLMPQDCLKVRQMGAIPGLLGVS